MVCLGGVLDGNLLQHAALGVHRRLPQLLVRHLTQTFVALRLNTRLAAVAVFLDEVMPLLVVPAVLLDIPFRAEVERCHGDIQVPLLNHLFHVAEEQRHDERSDMRTVHIGIRHDNHLMVTYLAQVQCFRVFLRAEGDT